MEAKKNPQMMLKVITLMKPLIKSYIKKAFFLDQDDAQQEMILAIIESVKRIPHCSSDGECINYIRNAVRINFAHLCKKNIFHQYEKEMSDYENEKKYNEKYSDIECWVDVSNLVNTLSDKKKNLVLLLLQGKSDQEIATELKVSRQYINRIKKEIFKNYYF